MPERISCRDQSDIARYVQVPQVAGLGQDEESAGDRTLDFIEFPAKILDEHFMQPFIDLSRFLPNESETFVQSLHDLGRDQLTRIQHLFDLWVLGCLAQFLVLLFFALRRENGDCEQRLGFGRRRRSNGRESHTSAALVWLQCGIKGPQQFLLIVWNYPDNASHDKRKDHNYHRLHRRIGCRNRGAYWEAE